MRNICLVILCLWSNILISKSLPVDSSLNYYFESPASCWNEAIPIGNGRIGGMVFGNVDRELIKLNEDTFWSGEPHDVQKLYAYRHLDKIRKSLSDGETIKAQELIDKYMLGPNNQSYMPLANMYIDVDGEGMVSDYRRELDLQKGIVNIKYRRGDVLYKRTIFASYPSQAIVVHLECNKQKEMNLSFFMDSKVRYTSSLKDNTFIINGQAPAHVEPNYNGISNPIYMAGHGMRFQGRMFVTDTDGTILGKDGKITICKASFVTLAFVVRTSYNGFDKNPFTDGMDEKLNSKRDYNRISKSRFSTLLKRHVADYSSLFSRVSLNLGEDTETGLPINERIKSYNRRRSSSLVALYYQYGRYLIISSSRPGTQPANLQGIWNEKLQPEWSSNWTLNCNAEINYWPVESANLSECHLPLMDLIADIYNDGRKTAANLYNSKGWIAHHNTDIWRTTWPVGGSGLWAIYQVGSAWLCQHIWEHYLFTCDEAFLKKYYFLMKEASIFYLDNLVMNKEGYWGTNPSTSFENKYRKPDGTEGWACVGPSQDMQLIGSLFRNTIKAMKILNVDDSLRSVIEKKNSQLIPIKISEDGQLQEWSEGWNALEPYNGQIAQAWGAVESDVITIHKTPDLARALKKTMEMRKCGLANNSGSWTGAFPVNLWARMGEGDKAQDVIDRHFHLAMYPNLTSMFCDCWQIDGNLGVASGISEMILQSHEGELSLLPALSSLIKSGHVKGLRARGGYEVEIYWNNKTLDKAIVKADNKGKVAIRYKNNVKEFSFRKGEKKIISKSCFD